MPPLTLPSAYSPGMGRLVSAERTSLFGVTRRPLTEVRLRIDSLIAAEVPYVLLWQSDSTRLLYWNKFGMPGKPLGIYGNESAILSYWWHDVDRAEELKWATGEGKCLPTTTD